MANNEELEEFKQYLLNKGENYDALSKEERRAWAETFDKYKVLKQSQSASAGFVNIDQFQRLLVQSEKLRHIDPKVIDLILKGHAPRAMMCSTANQALDLYFMIEQVPQTQTLKALDEGLDVLLNGKFLHSDRTLLINALHHGKPAILKVIKHASLAEKEFKAWEIVVSNKIPHELCIIGPMESIACDKASLLQTYIRGESERDPVQYGIIMPKYVGTISNYIGCKREYLAKWIMQIQIGLSHIHNKSMCHMDIKPDNIFLDAIGNAYIGDFGSTVAIGDDVKEFSPSYFPDDLIGVRASPQMDKYLLGSLILEMIGNYLPKPHSLTCSIIKERLSNKGFKDIVEYIDSQN